MAIVPAPTVPAPEPLGLRYGLLAAAAGPLDLPSPGGMGGGVTYDPVSCGGAHRIPMDCVDPDDPEEKTFDPADDRVVGLPFVTYASLTCGSVGMPGDLPEAKVRRRLANGEQAQVEAELADRLAALPATSVVSFDPTSLPAVFGALEQWLYGTDAEEQGYGNIGFIHAPLRFGSQAFRLGLRRDEVGRYRTTLGTVVVFGNYGDGGVIYITGHVTTWRAPEPAVSPRNQVLDRVTNQLYMLAEREWAIAYDCVAGQSIYSGDGVS